ncbi:MAG: methyltransferase [Clostridiaceae bacterium]|nr:methyltransferase [Clostridiaceae bacterium]
MNRYDEWIEKMKPLPRFNLQWYHGEDQYSDGDVEDVILQIIAENPPEEYVQAIESKFSWPSFYYLTHLRKNILNWYPFDPDADVLEIGCGLGAITGVLCDACKSVTAVELSKRRAAAALLRCREKENLEIIVGNLNDIVFEKKFDYITLIGVLEYQGSYTETQDPYCDFLKKVKKLLKPDGRLLLAIENQYGLKYWCGAREDHTGVPFDGINQYALTDRKVRTFSKKALSDLIGRSGFSHSFFYYPLPDYKLPTVIYSQEALPEKIGPSQMIAYYTPDGKTRVAREHDLYQDVIDNGVFAFFANSFLVECTDSEDFGEVSFVRLSSEREPEYRIGTRILRTGEVEKFPLAASCRHLEETLFNEQDMEAHGLKIWGSSMVKNRLVSRFCKAPSVENQMLLLYQNRDLDSIYALFDRLYEQVLQSSEQVSRRTNIMYELFEDIKPDYSGFGPVLKTGYLDMLLTNAFWIDGECYWYDQEWTIEHLPAKFILYRMIRYLYFENPGCARLISMAEIAQHYQLAALWNSFNRLEERFTGTVMDWKHMAESSVFRSNDIQTCAGNVNKLFT